MFTHRLYMSQVREWRGIHIPGPANDFSSLSSRGTSTITHNIDSGVGTDDDTAPHHRTTSQPRHQPKVANHHPHHRNNTAQRYLPQFTSRPPSNLSVSSSSDPSTSSLASSRGKSGREFVLFRPLSSKSSDLYPSDTIDDQCTTTSGSYSIDTLDHRGGGFVQNSNLEYIHDIYV